MTSVRASAASRALSTVESGEASSTTKMRPTTSGIPRNVVATRSSSRYAGTTTPTRLPSTIREVVLGGPAGVPARAHRVRQMRGDPAEYEPVHRADQPRVAPADERHD